MLLPSGNPFKCHEEVLSLQPMILPKRLDIFPPDWGICLEGLDAFRFFFKQQPNTTVYSLRYAQFYKKCPIYPMYNIICNTKSGTYIGVFFSSFFFISLIADGPHHYHPACGLKGSSHLSPVHALQFFYRDASSALLHNSSTNG